MTLPVVIKLPLLLLRRAIARFSPREDSGTGTTIATPIATSTAPAPAPMKMGTDRKENVKWVEVSVRSLGHQYRVDFDVGRSWHGVFDCRGYTSL
jgi:hypothetical protein